jgi:hypothetical protein
MAARQCHFCFHSCALQEGRDHYSLTYHGIPVLLHVRCSINTGGMDVITLQVLVYKYGFNWLELHTFPVLTLFAVIMALCSGALPTLHGLHTANTDGPFFSHEHEVLYESHVSGENGYSRRMDTRLRLAGVQPRGWSSSCH